MASILQEIAAYKREFVEHRKYRIPPDEMRARARDAEPPADFPHALRAEGISLIAEIKKASPSKGVIRADFDPGRIARTYAGNGARALSVLTDEAYFQGSDSYLRIARTTAKLPTLRKDFILDEYQVYETRWIGADALLLIVALMDGGQLEDLLGLGEELGMGVLVEVHTKAERERALGAGARLIGINNRDLATFETRLETTFELKEGLPDRIAVVSESGIHTRRDVERLEAAGIDAILVGEALMSAEDPGARMKQLLGE